MKYGFLNEEERKYLRSNGLNNYKDRCYKNITEKLTYLLDDLDLILKNNHQLGELKYRFPKMLFEKIMIYLLYYKMNEKWFYKFLISSTSRFYYQPILLDLKEYFFDRDLKTPEEINNYIVSANIKVISTSEYKEIKSPDFDINLTQDFSKEIAILNSFNNIHIREFLCFPRLKNEITSRNKELYDTMCSEFEKCGFIYSKDNPYLTDSGMKAKYILFEKILENKTNSSSKKSEQNSINNQKLIKLEKEAITNLCIFKDDLYKSLKLKETKDIIK